MPEEPCQCPDCQRFYKEHDRLVRESPTLRQQQELNWAALQSFRTLCGRVLEDLQKQQGAKGNETASPMVSSAGSEENNRNIPRNDGNNLFFMGFTAGINR